MSKLRKHGSESQATGLDSATPAEPPQDGADGPQPPGDRANGAASVTDQATGPVISTVDRSESTGEGDRVGPSRDPLPENAHPGTTIPPTIVRPDSRLI